MPTRENAPRGAPCWIDLFTSDVERSRQFYSEVFGWAAEAPAEEYGGYFIFTKDGVEVAGGMPNGPESGIADGWSVHLATADAAKTLEVATSNGGQVLVPVMQVGDLGSMAAVIDPGGARIGMWQAGAFPGFRVFGEAGTPGWFELLTRDYEAAVSFYREVFGWETQVMSDTPELRLTTLSDGDSQLAGIMDASGILPEGVASHWRVYFGVDDADATLARIVELGGKIVRQAEDTPFGRLAAASDPTGGEFKLVAPNEAMPARTSPN
jgi:predicted enzyme related to lactoylglutathione lyase